MQSSSEQRAESRASPAAVESNRQLTVTRILTLHFVPFGGTVADSLVQEHDIPGSRVFNLDETHLRLLPTHSYGWSVRGEKTKQHGDPKSGITATLVMPMEPGPLFGQLIFQGKTKRVEPKLEHMPERLLVDHTESHWQSTDTLVRLVAWLDSHINAATPGLPWCLLLDCASVHTSCDYRAKLKEELPHVQQVYVPGKSTSFNQPLDRSVMKGFKTAVSKECSVHFAVIILKALQDSHALAFDLSKPALKHLVVGWFEKALKAIEEKDKFFRSGWKHILADNPEHFAEICARAAAHHAGGTLFRKTHLGIVPEDAPLACEVAPVGVDPVMDPAADDQVVEEEGLLVLDEAESIEQPAPLAAAPVVVEQLVPPAAEPVAAGQPEPAAEPPAAPPLRPLPRQPLSMLDRCIALRLVYGRGPR